MIPRDRFAEAVKIARRAHEARRAAGRGWVRRVADGACFHMHAPKPGTIVRRSGNDLDPLPTECGRSLRGALVGERASNPRAKCRQCLAVLSRAEEGGS